MENHLKLRSGELTSAVGNFPMGLVLIEKEKQNQENRFNRFDEKASAFFKKI